MNNVAKHMMTVVVDTSEHGNTKENLEHSSTMLRKFVSIVAWQRALEVNIDSFKWLSSLDEWDPLRLVILRLEF